MARTKILKSDLSDALKTTITGIEFLKGSKNSLSEIQAIISKTNGDVYFAKDTRTFYQWNGSDWQANSGSGGGGGGSSVNYLDDILDVAIISAANNDVLIREGSDWKNKPIWNAVPEGDSDAKAGFISAEDQKKLNELSNYTHLTGDGNEHVPPTLTTNDGKFLKVNSATAGDVVWSDLPVASDSQLGIIKVGDGLSSVSGEISIKLNATNPGLESDENGIKVKFGTTESDVAKGNHEHSLDALSDVDVSGASAGQIMKKTSTGWVNTDLFDESTSQIKISLVPPVGAAPEAAKLSTARTISLAGDATGSASFDGTANISINATLKSSGAISGTYTKVTVNEKGIVTSGQTSINISDVANLQDELNTIDGGTF